MVVLGLGFPEQSHSNLAIPFCIAKKNKTQKFEFGTSPNGVTSPLTWNKIRKTSTKQAKKWEELLHKLSLLRQGADFPKIKQSA
jgi:hypothetical protein